MTKADKFEQQFSQIWLISFMTKYKLIKFITFQMLTSFEMTFNNDTIVEEYLEIDSDIPEIKYEFTPIAEVKKMEKNSLINVNGIWYEVRGLNEFIAKSTGKSYKKRDIILIDESNETMHCRYGIQMQNHLIYPKYVRS